MFKMAFVFSVVIFLGSSARSFASPAVSIYNQARIYIGAVKAVTVNLRDDIEQDPLGKVRFCKEVEIIGLLKNAFSEKEIYDVSSSIDPFTLGKFQVSYQEVIALEQLCEDGLSEAEVSQAKELSQLLKDNMQD